MPKLLFRLSLATAVLAALTSPALAQGGPESGRYSYGPHMMGWDGGWSMFFFGPLFMIIFLAILVAAIVLLVKWLGGMTGVGPTQQPPANRALDILKERFARGEIDKAEFEERRRLLGE